MPELTIADLDQAETRLQSAKKARRGKRMNHDDYQNVKREVVAVRRAWREQEEKAGRRTGFVGGDAVKSEE